MTMQRRHFELIAETIAELADGNHPLHGQDIRMIALRFANKLRATNPNFNRDRFLRACGVE